MRRLPLAALLSSVLGCSGTQHPTAPGSTFDYTVSDQTETRVCESRVTPQASCTVTLDARAVLGELEGREWQIPSLATVVRDGRSGQDLHASPGTLTGEDIRRIAGSNVLPARGSLSIPIHVQFAVGQAPYYVDGPHVLSVTWTAVTSATR